MKRNRVVIIGLVLICIVLAVLIVKENHKERKVLFEPDDSLAKEKTVNSKENINAGDKIAESTETLDNAPISEQTSSSSVEQIEELEEVSFINLEGTTMATRIHTPEGYERMEVSKDSLLYFMRNLKLKPDGSPVAINEEGEKCYLLAQGYMPAQDFHILKNPANSLNPWYYESDLEYPIQTPQYTFEEGSIRRWMEGFN